MKKNNSIVIKNHTYSDPPFEDKIRNLIQQAKESVMELVPDFRGKEFRGDDRDRVFSLISQKFSVISREVDSYAQKDMRQGLVNETLQNRERKALGYNQAQQDLQKDKAILEKEQKLFRPKYDFSRLKWVIFFYILLYVGEAVLLGGAFYSFLRDNFLVVIISCITFATALALFNHYIGKHILKIIRNRAKLIVLCAFYLLLYISIAVFRSKSLNEDFFSWTTLMFVLMSIVITIASFTLSAFKFPSDEERLKKKQYDEYGKKIRTVEAKLDALGKEQVEQPKKAREEVFFHVGILSFTKHLKELIVAEEEVCKAEFLNKVVIYIK